MSHNENEDFEDGELPEDGEICDDEEDGEHRNNNVGKQRILSAVKANASRATHPEPVTPAAPQHAPAVVNGPSARDSRERGERSERPRRFEHGSPPARDPDPFGPHNDEPEHGNPTSR